MQLGTHSRVSNHAEPTRTIGLGVKRLRMNGESNSVGGRPLTQEEIYIAEVYGHRRADAFGRNTYVRPLFR